MIVFDSNMKTLLTLDISFNPIGPTEVQLIANALNDNIVN